MKKKTALHRMLSLVLAAALVLSIPMTALAEETTGTVDVETTAGNQEPVNVTVTIESSSTDAGTNVQTTTVAEGAVTSSGMTVDYQGSGDMTPRGSVTTGTEESSYSVSGTVDGQIYTAEGGSELEISAEAPQVSVDVSLTQGDSNTAADGETGTETVTGDVPEDTQDGTYDYTRETVTQQGEVTVTTTEVSKEVLPEEETEQGYESDLDLVHTDATPDANNDLFTDTSCDAEIPETEADIPAAAEGYDYVLLGSENSSRFFGAVLYTSPSEDYPEETPLYSVNGVDYYLHRKDIRDYLATGKSAASGYYVEGFYVDGQRLPVDSPDATGNDKYIAKWSSIQQFTLIDSETGELITTYCADQNTYATNGFSYNMVNIEDASYYTEEQAAMIRTVASNGYWGNEEGAGSLDAMRDMMRGAKDENGNAVFTEEEINNVLSDGVAMTATQYAIWTFSNAMDDVAFINAHYVKTNDALEASASLGVLGNIPEAEQASVDLIFKLYNYLINLDPDTVEDPTTANTVITAENAVKDLSVTVLEKAEGHENNLDNSSDNDAYVTSLSFALVVTPSTENGDDMIVKVMSGGKVIKEARIAGNAKEGETLDTLNCDENGNYTIPDIILTEGNQEFNITLEGIQNLDQGIYLYTSEIRNENGEEETSQTMVGMAGGTQEVNVSMTISFDLDVQDKVVTTEHVWRQEQSRPVPTPEVPHEYYEERTTFGRRVNRVTPQEPDSDNIIIEDEPIPLAKAPVTGDNSAIAAMFALLSGFGLAVLALTEKGRKAF